MARKELAGRETHCLEVTAQVEAVCDRGRINIQSFMRGTKARYLGDGPSKQEFFTMQVIIFLHLYF